MNDFNRLKILWSYSTFRTFDFVQNWDLERLRNENRWCTLCCVWARIASFFAFWRLFVYDFCFHCWYYSFIDYVYNYIFFNIILILWSTVYNSGPLMIMIWFNFQNIARVLFINFYLFWCCDSWNIFPYMQRTFTSARWSSETMDWIWVQWR